MDMKAAILPAMLVLLAGCSDIPRDPAGTLERVRQSGLMRIGVVSDAGAPIDEQDGGFIGRLAAETGSRPEITRGAAETLLPAVERGDLDIVIGRFTPDTPWRDRVTLLPQPGWMTSGKGQAAPGVMVRNGENGWIALVHRHAAVLGASAR